MQQADYTGYIVAKLSEYAKFNMQVSSDSFLLRIL